MTKSRDLWFAGALVASLTVLAGPALAQTHDVYLVARPFTATMPDSTAVPMWGFAEDADNDLSTVGAEIATSPGPRIQVPLGTTSLNIHLRNDLAVPVSLMIPGQIAPSNPTWVDTAGTVVGTGSRPAGDVTSRMRSLSAEAAPGGGTATYSYSNPRPGSFIYHSSTNPAVQVPMGLYGAVTMNSAAGEAYAGVPFTNEAILFYSEIDPDLNNAVDAGTFGPVVGSTYPSMIDYRPQYFLINGAPYAASAPTAPILQGPITTSDTLLLRFFNAGLRTVVPTANNLRWDLVAEDGFASPHRKNAYTVQLDAGKTKDAILTPTMAGQFAIFERRLSLNNAGVGPGGMIVKLDVAAGGTGPMPPVAVDDTFGVNEDTTLTVVAASGVLANDTPPNGLSAVLNSAVSAGSLALNAAGSFVYTPPANFNGPATFTYVASDGTLTSAPATVTINVAAVNDAPVANADGPYSTPAGVALNVGVPGVLGNDTDVDIVGLTAVLDPGSAVGGSVALNADGSFTYTPTAGFSGAGSFRYFANDGLLNSAVAATVSITVVPVNTAPVANNDSARMVRNTTAVPNSLVIDILANDTDAQNNIDPTTVTIVASPNKGGTVAVNPVTGAVTYTPKLNFTGSENFRYRVKDVPGLVSNTARVTVNVTRR